MKKYHVEVTFVYGKSKGQVWLYKNLALVEIVDLYSNLSLNVIENSEIYVLDNEKRLPIYRFLDEIVMRAYH